MATVYEAGSAGTYKTELYEPAWGRISWGAIFAGTIVALVVQIALSLLGLGIGLGIINPAAEQRFAAFGIGTGIWMLISSLISLFIGGWVASRVSGISFPAKGMMHGLVVWGLATLFAFYLMTSAVGGLLSGFAGALGRGLSFVGSVSPQAIQQVIPGQAQSPESIMQEARRTFTQSARPEFRGAADPEFEQALNGLFGPGGDPASTTNRQALVNVFTAKTTISGADATNMVNGWAGRYSRMLAQAPTEGGALQAAEQATNALSMAAIWGFISLILGAVAAVLGGRMGATKEVTVTALPSAQEKERARAA